MSSTQSEPAPPMISVVIVDDHEMVATGLQMWLESEVDIHVIGVAGSVEKGVALARELQPDVVLMDYRLPDGDGITATRLIIETHPEMSVIMLSGAVNQDLLEKAIEAGCSGFLAKERGSTDLVEAVRAAAKGETILPKEVLNALMTRMRNPSPKLDHGLTRQEINVLRLLAKGLSTSAISEQLFIAVHTTRNHIRNVTMKIGAHSKLEAVAIAMREGLLIPNDFE